MTRNIYNDIIKRSLDVLAAATGMLVLSPVFAGIALTLFVRHPKGKIIFTQERPGKDGRSFIIYKFRSMRNLYDSHGNIMPDEARISGPGSLLRRSGLDELPQLWNVLRGEMSIVGPRPLLPHDLSRASGRALSLRHSVRPGITGWVQVNGRNSIPWERKFELDEWYVRHISFAVDASIVMRTFRAMLPSSQKIKHFLHDEHGG
jgi:lipopolysaccharide/colanic/teichoic acid biosynthesis glycosyltransferase